MAGAAEVLKTVQMFTKAFDTPCRISIVLRRHYNRHRYNPVPTKPARPATTLKLTRHGTSTGMIIPKEMLARMKVEQGDVLFAIQTTEGYLLTPYDPSIAAQLRAGRAFMKENRDVFKALAK